MRTSTYNSLMGLFILTIFVLLVGLEIYLFIHFWWQTLIGHACLLFLSFFSYKYAYDPGKEYAL